jgi:hypothetical protein
MHGRRCCEVNRAVLLVCVLLTVAPLASRAAGAECLDSTGVRVYVLATPLPADSTELDSVLWEHFIRGPVSEQSMCPMGEGEGSRVDSFARSMIRQASADSLDAESLRRCLAIVQNQPGASHSDGASQVKHRSEMSLIRTGSSLPVGASHGEYKGVPVWVILVKWGWLMEGLEHARVYVLDAKDGRQIGFATCD